MGGGRKPNLCGSVLSMPLFGAFGRSVTLVSIMASIRTSKSYGIGLSSLLLLDARRMIFLEGCLSQICREIGEHFSFDIFFVCSTFCIEDLLSSMLFVYPSLLVNNISSSIKQKNCMIEE